MHDPFERLLALRVVDAMNSQLICLSQCDAMDSAARTFAANGISAAPVLDSQDVCVGVLSVSDFARRDAANCGRGEHCGEELVESYMTRAVQSISGDASLLHAARLMDEQHTHRLIVLDEHRHPRGILSGMDVIAAVLNAVDEMTISLIHG